MAQPDLEGRSEDATPRRREQARSEGQVAYSGDLMIGAVCFVVALLMRWQGSTWLVRAAEWMRAALGRLPMTDWTVVETQASVTWVLGGVAACCLTAIVYGLMSPQQWNARFNPGAPQESSPGVTRWSTIFAIVIALMLGAGVLMASLAFSLQHYFEYQVQEGRRISQ